MLERRELHGNQTVLIAVALIAVVAGTAGAFLKPVWGLTLAASLGVFLLAIHGALRLSYWLILLLASKPLVDLTWRWRFFDFAEQGVNIQTVVAVFAILLTAMAMILRRRDLVWSKVAVALLAMASLSVLLTPTSWGVNELIRLFAALSFTFTAGFALSRAAEFERFSGYFVLAVAVAVLLALFQKAGIVPFEYWDWIQGERIGRVSGSYQHPLGLIYFLVYAVPLSLYLIAKPSLSLQYRLLLWSFIGISLVALAFTYHRTAILVIGLQIWLWMVLSRKYGRAILLITLGGLLALWLREWLGLLYANVGDIIEGEVAFSSGDFLRGRGARWYLFLHSLFSSHPVQWLVGRGGSVAEGLVPNYGYLSSNEPHNDFIRILHAYGFVGLGLYLVLLLSFFRQSFRLRRARDFFSRRLGSLMIVVLTGIILLSITTEPTRYPTGAWYLFALGSVVMRRYSRLREAHRAALGENRD